MRSDWLIDKAIKMYKDKGENKQMLVFCVDKKHSLQVKQAYIKAGFTKIAHVDSDTPNDDRIKINQDYRDKKLDIIISIQTFTEGVDLPNTGVIQLLRPTLSVVLYIQILGRGTRIKDDKDKLIILDLSNNSYEHGLLDSDFNWNLNNDEPNPNKKVNKIIGRKKNGKITINEDEIEEEYLEIEEMSHNDFLLQNQNGLDIANNENKLKDELIILKFNNLLKELNTKCKIKDIKFESKSENILFYNNWKEFKSYYKNKELLTIIYEEESLKISTGWISSYKGVSEFVNLILKGEVTKFLSKISIYELILKTFTEIKEIHNSKIDLTNLKKKIDDIDKEKCIFKIDKLLSQGTYKFELHTECHNSDLSSRNGWGRFDSISFIEGTKRLKVNNSIKVNNISGYGNSNYPNLNKDILIDILYNNWYKQKQ